MQALIKRGGIDGVFCGDDILAIGAVDACRECGMSVPKDPRHRPIRRHADGVLDGLQSHDRSSAGGQHHWDCYSTSSYRLSRSQGGRRLRSFSLARRSFGAR